MDADPGRSASAHDKKERKRLQNRRNQQARRDRLRQTKEDTSQRSFSVQRWRLSKDEETNHPDGTRESSHPQRSTITASARLAAAAAAMIKPSPQTDMLLTLINQNVVRALGTNKSVLHLLVTDCYRDFPSTLQPMSEPQPCEGLIITTPAGRGQGGAIPVSLLPTELQRAVPHSPWINVVPFPRMRDNLIRWHDGFDHWEFLSDMTGYLVDRGLFSRGPTGPAPAVSSGRVAYSTRHSDGPEEEDDDPLAAWNGAIVWGEPYRKENWEFTAHFLAKWAWVFEGCEEIVTVTNSWRRGRGAPLLRSHVVAVGA